MIKAQALYDKSLFEHSFIYFSRSIRYSPTSEKAKSGVKKCIRTIKNSLKDDVFNGPKSSKFLKQLLSFHSNRTISKNHNSDKVSEKEDRNYKHVNLLQGEQQYVAKIKKSFMKIKMQNNRNQNLLMNVLSDAEDYLEDRKEFWYQL